MKKSELFKLAQIAVLNDGNMLISKKTDVLELLLYEESLAKLVEESKEKKEEENANEAV